MRHTIIRPAAEVPPCPYEAMKARYKLSQRIQHGFYAIEIDPVAEVGFFGSQNGYRGQFWLAGKVFLGADHLLPRPVQEGLALHGVVMA